MLTNKTHHMPLQRIKNLKRLAWKDVDIQITEAAEICSKWSHSWKYSPQLQ